MSGPASKLMTPRQLELLALYASGDDFTEIAQKKFLSHYTVRNILYAAQKRVGARNLTHLSVICVNEGIIRQNGTGYKPVTDERVVG